MINRTTWICYYYFVCAKSIVVCCNWYSNFLLKFRFMTDQTHFVNFDYFFIVVVLVIWRENAKIIKESVVFVERRVIMKTHVGINTQAKDQHGSRMKKMKMKTKIQTKESQQEWSPRVVSNVNIAHSKISSTCRKINIYQIQYRRIDIRIYKPKPYRDIEQLE